MDLAELFKALKRRWLIAVPILAVSLVAAIVVVTSADSDFEATASLLLAGPELLGSADQASHGGIPLNASVVAEIVEGDETRAGLGVVDESTDYSVDLSGDGTIIQIEAFSATEEGVVPTAEAVIGSLVDTVAELSADLESEQVERIDFRVLSVPTTVRERTVFDSTGEGRVEYYATGSVLLRIDDPEPVADNPYTASGGTIRVLQEVAAAPTTRREVLADIEGADFAVTTQSRDSAPIIYVTATGPEADSTLEALDAAMAFLDEELVQRQEVTGAPESDWLVFQRLYVPEEATELAGNVRRPLVAILGLGAVAAVSLSVLADALLNLRQRRREESGEPGDSTTQHIEKVS